MPALPGLSFIAAPIPDTQPDRRVMVQFALPGRSNHYRQEQARAAIL
jgi:hypothetical protein